VRRWFQFALSLALVFVAAGCPARFGTAATGAGSSDAAVQQFLFAAKAQDLQAMSAVWGDEQGATRDRVDRSEMEQRLMIMVCHLRHDESRIGAAANGEAGRILHRVELTQGEKKAAPLFTAVRNAQSGRWYVYDIELQALSGWCSGMTPPKPTPPRPRTH
jgi:hypothetical protein